MGQEARGPSAANVAGIALTGLVPGNIGALVALFAIGFAGYSLWTLAGWIARVVAAFLA